MKRIWIVEWKNNWSKKWDVIECDENKRVAEKLAKYHNDQNAGKYRVRAYVPEATKTKGKK